MKKLTISAITILALSSSIAIAGGKLVEPPQVPPKPIVVDEWSGPYVGVEAGYLKGKSKINIDVVSKQIGPLTHGNAGMTTSTYSYDRFTLKPDGFTAGVFAGFNKLLESDWLIGVEASVNYVNAKDEKTLYSNGDEIKDEKFLLKQTLDYALYGRLGKVMGEEKNLMPYILAGITGAKLKGKLTSYGKTYWDKETVTGWTVGAGLEYKLNKNWHMRVQYRYSKYDDAKFNYKINNSTNYKAVAKDYKTHTIRVGISYCFN